MKSIRKISGTNIWIRKNRTIVTSLPVVCAVSFVSLANFWHMTLCRFAEKKECFEKWNKPSEDVLQPLGQNSLRHPQRTWQSDKWSHSLQQQGATRNQQKSKESVGKKTCSNKAGTTVPVQTHRNHAGSPAPEEVTDIMLFIHMLGQLHVHKARGPRTQLYSKMRGQFKSTGTSCFIRIWIIWILSPVEITLLYISYVLICPLNLNLLNLKYFYFVFLFSN